MPLHYWILTVILFLVLVYLIRLSVKMDNLTKEQRAEGLKLLREFTEHCPRITSWLKEHKEELQRHPMITLNSQEFVDLINRDQALYEKILEIYPDYSNTIMPPKELRQYFIEIVQGQHRQIH